MNHPFLQLLVRWSVLALGVTLATKLVTGIHCDTLGTLVVVVLLLSFFNAVLKPLLVLFTLPLIMLSLGFGMLFINALLFMLVGKLMQPDFQVSGFWAALGGALIVSITNIVVSMALGRRRPPGSGPGTGPGRGRSERPAVKGDDVIDI